MNENSFDLTRKKNKHYLPIKLINRHRHVNKLLLIKLLKIKLKSFISLNVKEKFIRSSKIVAKRWHHDHYTFSEFSLRYDAPMYFAWPVHISSCSEDSRRADPPASHRYRWDNSSCFRRRLFSFAWDFFQKILLFRYLMRFLEDLLQTLFTTK